MNYCLEEKQKGMAKGVIRHSKALVTLTWMMGSRIERAFFFFMGDVWRYHYSEVRAT